ncbi:MAG TPA: hypothetical protein PL161_11160, partial [Spirochaetota bacterium]|nr:hypothetical protein [Spirochaetota bacterium]
MGMNDKKSVLIIHFFYSPISQRVMTSMSALTSRYPAERKFGVIRALIHPLAFSFIHSFLNLLLFCSLRIRLIVRICRM